MFKLSFILTAFLSQISYLNPAEFIVAPKYLRDEEPAWNWPTPPDPNMPRGTNWWVAYNGYADYMGLLFAGKTQFPWIVDVRVEDQFQESWATGNLLTADHVATSCRALKYFRMQEEISNIKVTYCAQAVGENENFGAVTSGIRWIRNYTLHKKCENGEDQTACDIGVMKLESAIHPIPPFIGYAPFPYHELGTVLKPTDLETMDSQRLICYVAAFGRQFTNKEDHMVLNFKVKYRVYYYNWAECQNRAEILCPTRDQKCLDGVTTEDLRLSCMKTRALVGTVCDHDRGAPLVCDGEVYGFVVRGAPSIHCNNRLPLPFVVSNVYWMQQFLRQFLDQVMHPSECPDCRDTYSEAPSMSEGRLFLILLPSLLYAMNWPTL